MAAVASNGTGQLIVQTQKLSIKDITCDTRRLKDKISKLDKLYNTMQQQQDDIQWLLEAVIKWNDDFKNIVRFSQGVPQMRATKDICSKIKSAMIANGEFDRTVRILVKEDAPCFSRVMDLFEQLKGKLDERSPNAKFSEEIRQLFGEIIGTLSTILNYFYDQ